MGLKIVNNYDASFTLEPEPKAALFSLLNSEAFLEHISEQVQGKKVEFADLIFQPVPYSIATPKGMPVEFEAYYNCQDYLIINIPPNFMFKAKIFQPSRLCAIYKLR